MRQTFDSNTVYNSSRGPLLLSAAVAAQFTIIERSYVIPELTKYVDFINLMTYDYYIFHWYWPFVGHNSPLFARPIELGLFSTFNTKWSANHWNRMGANKNKIMVGIPTYGRSFRMAFSWLTIPGTLVLSGSPDKSYSQMCEEYLSEASKLVMDPQSRVPYGYRGNQWFTYENEESAAEKTKWIKDNGFGGVMTFSLNADDFKNKCTTDGSLFPIHSAIKTAIV